LHTETISSLLFELFELFLLFLETLDPLLLYLDPLLTFLDSLDYTLLITLLDFAEQEEWDLGFFIEGHLFLSLCDLDL
jgi:hypothetical protein